MRDAISTRIGKKCHCRFIPFRQTICAIATGMAISIRMLTIQIQKLQKIYQSRGVWTVRIVCKRYVMSEVE